MRGGVPQNHVFVPGCPEPHAGSGRNRGRKLTAVLPPPAMLGDAVAGGISGLVHLERCAKSDGFRNGMGMIWPPQQEAALKAIAAWLKRGEPQLFRLFGYAGTGKTTLAKKIAEDTDGGVVFAAFTGKAALVMRCKGCEDARTIHILIYRARETDTEEPSL